MYLHNQQFKVPRTLGYRLQTRLKAGEKMWCFSAPGITGEQEKHCHLYQADADAHALLARKTYRGATPVHLEELK